MLWPHLGSFVSLRSSHLKKGLAERFRGMGAVERNIIKGLETNSYEKAGMIEIIYFRKDRVGHDQSM